MTTVLEKNCFIDILFCRRIDIVQCRFLSTFLTLLFTKLVNRFITTNVANMRILSYECDVSGEVILQNQILHGMYLSILHNHYFFVGLIKF